MKKLRFLILAAAAAICLCSASAFAKNEDMMPDNKVLFENLGFILPEKTSGNELVTRGEFIYTITQFIGDELRPKGVLSFSDVSNDNKIAGALTYAVSNGLVSDGDMFYPDEPITYDQAYKMAVAFIGRTIEAEQAGGWPGGYAAVAVTQKLTKGLKDTAGEKLTVRDFYIMLENI